LLYKQKDKIKVKHFEIWKEETLGGSDHRPLVIIGFETGTAIREQNEPPNRRKLKNIKLHYMENLTKS
jgi:hypothetical protein